MTTHWEFIAERLRDELAAYGGLLRLFEDQQVALFNRDADTVLHYAAEIEDYTRTLAETRTRREVAVAAFAESNGQPSTASLRSMLPLIEVNVRPLMEALIREVNLLLHRVRRTSRHNHTLLSRAVESTQDTIQLLRPHSFMKMYSPAGMVSVGNSGPATLRAAG